MDEMYKYALIIDMVTGSLELHYDTLKEAEKSLDVLLDGFNQISLASEDAVIRTSHGPINFLVPTYKPVVLTGTTVYKKVAFNIASFISAKIVCRGDMDDYVVVVDRNNKKADKRKEEENRDVEIGKQIGFER